MPEEKACVIARIPRELHRLVKQRSLERGESIQAIIERALVQYVAVKPGERTE